MSEVNKVWVQFYDMRKKEYDATSFTIESGALVLWDDNRRLSVTAAGRWTQAAMSDWLETNGPKDEEPTT